MQRYEQVRALYHAGAAIKAIADHLGMHRRTVRLFIRSDILPERVIAAKRPCQLGPYLPHLKERWAAGCHTSTR